MITEGAVIETQTRMNLPIVEITTPRSNEPASITIGQQIRRGPRRGQFPVAIYGKEGYQTGRMFKFFKKLQDKRGKTRSIEELTSQLNQSPSSIMRTNNPFTKNEIRGLFFMLRVKYEKDTSNPQLFIQDENGIGFFPPTLRIKTS